jgi:hypothetical protein
VSDPVFLRDPSRGMYRLLDSDVHARIVEGGFRF